MELTTEQKKAMAMANARLRITDEKPPSDFTLEDAPISIGNTIGAAVEPIMHIGSGGIASALGGLSGVGSLMMGDSREHAEGNIKKIIEAMTYQPRTEGGKVATEAITYPFKKIGEFGDYGGSESAKVTDSPAYGAATNTVINAIAMALGGKAAGKLKIPDKGMLEKIEATPYAGYIPKKIHGAVDSAKSAVRNRLPGGTERAVSDILDEVLGKRKQAALERIRQAEPGETAPQAAVGSGATKFSALQKLAEKIKPDDMYEISKSQQSARKGAVREFAKTPEETALLEKALKRRSEKLYGKSSSEKIAPDSPQKLTGISLSELSSRPSITSAIEVAKKAALEAPERFGKWPEEGQSFNVAQLQRIKRAVAENLNAEAAAGTLGKTTKGEIGSTVDKFTDWLRKKSPDFAKAEDAFAKDIKPINRQKVGQAILEKMDDTLDVKERPASFATAIKNAKKIVKKETGRTQPLKEVMLPEEMAVFKKIKKEYQRDAQLYSEATKGNAALKKIIEQEFDVPTAGILNTVVVLVNTIIKRVKGKNTKASLDLLTDIIKPENRGQLITMLEKATPAERSLLQSRLKNQAIVGGSIAGAEKE